MNNRPTSHFIGVKLDSDGFVHLYLQLQGYIEKNRLQDSTELQNRLSLHTTLYYLESDIPDEDTLRVKNFILEFRRKEVSPTVFLTGFDYFTHQGAASILYIKPANDSFADYQKSLSQIFQRNTIIDNQHAFIPHVTLFKILDADIYQEHRSEIEGIVTSFLQSKSAHNFFVGISLFSVNSQEKPQMQIPIF